MPNQVGVLQGRQIKDSNPHKLVIIVRREADKARIESMLDGQPLYQWTGELDKIELPKWPIEPGHLGLGTHKDDWTVSEVMVKPL